MLPLSTNLKEAYGNGRDDEQNFIQNLALFLCCYLKEHGSLLEEKVLHYKRKCFFLRIVLHTKCDSSIYNTSWVRTLF